MRVLGWSRAVRNSNLAEDSLRRRSIFECDRRILRQPIKKLSPGCVANYPRLSVDVLCIGLCIVEVGNASTAPSREFEVIRFFRQKGRMSLHSAGYILLEGDTRESAGSWRFQVGNDFSDLLWRKRLSSSCRGSSAKHRPHRVIEHECAHNRVPCPPDGGTSTFASTRVPSGRSGKSAGTTTCNSISACLEVIAT